MTSFLWISNIYVGSGYCLITAQSTIRISLLRANTSSSEGLATAGASLDWTVSADVSPWCLLGRGDPCSEALSHHELLRDAHDAVRTVITISSPTDITSRCFGLSILLFLKYSSRTVNKGLPLSANVTKRTCELSVWKWYAILGVLSTKDAVVVSRNIDLITKCWYFNHEIVSF